ncbi:MAG: hypothetical protein AAF636_17705 [Pseudomonadota bacterium]
MALAALTACAPAAPTAEDLVPEYLGVETTLLADDLVQFNVSMTKALSTRDLQDYADCAAAQYAVIRGWTFAQHVRTNVNERAGVWAADAVYTISPDLPDGLKKIDAEVTVAACLESGIPTV